MLVVSDTSPLLNLIVIQRLELLKHLYGEIVIPSAVFSELQNNQICVTVDWIRVMSPQDRAAVDALRTDLDAGESEAIVLARELNASLLLMDERMGRRIATKSGLAVTGLLGILAEAKARGLIPLCAPVLDEMINQAGFWIGERLRADYLIALGEITPPS